MDLKILRRLWLRNTLWTTIIIIFFLFGLALGKANASSLEQPQSPQKPFNAISVDVWEEKRVAPTTTSTVATTTTTVLVVKTTPKPINTTPVVAPTGDWVTQCHTWANMAGIELPPSAIKLIQRESSCNPTVMNHGGSGAGGIAQALPYTKMGCPMTYTDEAATCQLRWMLNYVNVRHGGWDGALAHSNAKGWY
jgi:hypothetical protein